MSVKIMPKELDKSVDIIMNKINLFRNFYESQTELYRRTKYIYD